MEPVLEEEASRRSLQEQQQAQSLSRRTTGHSAPKPAPFTSSRSKGVGKDHPSLKYKDIDEAVSRVVLAHAQAPPKPTLPRRSGLRTWNATAKERNPLHASLTGPGRAGKYAQLVGDSGGHYEGEVLAGRPHGSGRYMASKGPGSSQHILQYEGDWVQGRREGMGTRYFVNGEQYSGQFVANIRHGTGRYYFANGDMYVGQWLDDRRTGRGTYFYASGDIFVGNFVRDKKEGMGTLYMMERQKKYIAEFVSGAPKCGTVLELEDDDLEPLRGQMVNLALHKKLDLASSGRTAPKLPELQLRQPNKVLGEQIVAVRRARTESKSATLRAVQDNSGTLSDKDLEMLRHSFTLMAAGDDLKAGLLPHQLRELCVMAGLDPAASITRSLVEALLARREESTGRINFDSFLKVALHFHDTEVEDMFDVEETMAHGLDDTVEVVEDEEELVEPGGYADAGQQDDFGDQDGQAVEVVEEEVAVAAQLAVGEETSMQQIVEGQGVQTDKVAEAAGEEAEAGTERALDVAAAVEMAEAVGDLAESAEVVGKAGLVEAVGEAVGELVEGLGLEDKAAERDVETYPDAEVMVQEDGGEAAGAAGEEVEEEAAGGEEAEAAPAPAEEEGAEEAVGEGAADGGEAAAEPEAAEEPAQASEPAEDTPPAADDESPTAQEEDVPADSEDAPIAETAEETAEGEGGEQESQSEEAEATADGGVPEEDAPAEQDPDQAPAETEPDEAGGLPAESEAAGEGAEEEGQGEGQVAPEGGSGRGTPVREGSA